MIEAIVYFLMDMLMVDNEKARVLYWSCPKYCVILQAEHIAMLIGEKGIGRYIHFKREMGYYSHYTPDTPREFSEEEVCDATNSFSEVIGKGPFGCVYKGECGHIPIAVKVINPVNI